MITLEGLMVLPLYSLSPLKNLYTFSVSFNEFIMTASAYSIYGFVGRVMMKCRGTVFGYHFIMVIRMQPLSL